MIRKRIDQAGIRLAGELNKLFHNATAPKVDMSSMLANKATQGFAGGPVDIKDVSKFIGKTIYVMAKAYSSKDISSMLLVHLGAAFPDQLLTLAIKGEAKAVAVNLDSKTVTVTGQEIDYKWKPELIMTDPNQLKVQ